MFVVAETEPCKILNFVTSGKKMFMVVHFCLILEGPYSIQLLRELFLFSN